MNPPGQAEMPFTELDIHHLTGRANWVAERASLSETQLEALVTLVKHPMSPERRELIRVRVSVGSIPRRRRKLPIGGRLCDEYRT